MQKYLLKAKATQQYVKIKPYNGNTKNGIKLKSLILSKGIKQNACNSQKAKVDVIETIKNYVVTNKFEIKIKNSLHKNEVLVLLLIDSSSSMMKHKQIACVKGMIENTIKRYKQKKLKYGAVCLSNGEAQLLSPLTANTSLILHAVEKFTTGGKTNMKAGFKLIKDLIKTSTYQHINLFIFTDGKINAGNTTDPFNEAVLFYKAFLKSIKEVTVIDYENEFIKLGLSEKLATEIGAKYISLSNHELT